MSVPFGLIYRRIGWISWTTTCLLLVGCTEHTPPTGGGTGSAHLFEIRVEKKNIDELGADLTQEVTLDKAYYRLTGFDFTLAYDPVVVHVQSVQAGEMITNCEWEYFSYRNELAGNSYAPGKLHVRAIAGANGGRPLGAGSCQTEGELTEPAVLFTLNWYVPEDRTLECMYIPIRFYWEDCDDNIVTYSPGWGNEVGVEAACYRIFDFDLMGDIGDDMIGFPTFQGYQRECYDVALNQGVSPVRLVEFINGGLDNVCADSDTPKVPTPDMGR